ncbi:hypothetical protein ACNJ7E_18100 [Rhodococcus sp. NM-2]|uniref:hypothetical protein n=1 Tax=Rhodococcus sp. NM-2 TaxID=3401174 RepID=UPI003AB06B03
MRRRWFTPRRCGATLAAALTIPGVLLLSGAPTAAAAPIDTVLPGPVVGLTGPVASGHVMVRTDTDSPGITRFLGTGGRCACVVHWRNVSTGASGSADLRSGPGHSRAMVFTGPGVLVATVTAVGVAGAPITLLPGVGAWTVR